MSIGKKSIKKLTIKSMYKKIVKPVLNVITFRSIGKGIKYIIFNILRYYNNKKYINNLQKNFPENAVLMFQYTFFDKKGETYFNGGAERYIKDLSNILKKLNYTPILIQIGDKKQKREWVKNVNNLIVYGLPSKDVFDYCQKISFFKKYKFVIYSSVVFWNKKSLLHPNILISHGITWDYPRSKKINNNDILNYFNDFDNLVSVDINTISWLRTTFPNIFYNKKVFYIPNYVDNAIYKKNKKSSNNNIKIIFPRRACAERGYWLVSKILPIILNKYPNVYFDFIGFIHTDEIMDDIKYLIDLFPNRIKHYLVEPDKMPSFYESADISLIPTLYCEGTSLSCLEALASGNVVIATNIGGLPNLIIDGYNGILINPDENELIKALDRVINNKDLRDELSLNALKISKVFDIKIWVKRWEEIIKISMLS